MRVFVFSTMKAGTMFLHELLSDIAQQNHITHYSRNYSEDSPFHIPSESSDRMKDYITQDGCYGPFRHYFQVPKTDDVRVILHFRDPRDVLTSMYFYVAYHQKHISQATRNVYIKQGIDRFVLSPRLPEAPSALERAKQRFRRFVHLDSPPTMAEWLLQDYQLYFDEYLALPQTTVLTYEEMVTHFACWLPKFLSALSLENTHELVEPLLAKHKDSFTPPDIRDLESLKHKRQVTPGDYKRKMSATTIQTLNQIFAPQLSTLGYETSLAS